MPTDSGGPVAPLRLDEIGEEQIKKEVRSFEKKSVPFVFLEATPASRERIQSTLLSLRASNISGMLTLLKNGNPSADEVTEFFGFLRDWDQLTLTNLLALCGDWVPEAFRGEFSIEAKIEQKWMKEWMVASQDPRIAKYPGLPWRSFIRKINQENYAFAQTFVRFAAPDSEERSDITIGNLLRAFLKSRKKAICLFPKKWEKLQ